MSEIMILTEIDKILNYKTYSIRRKVDALLEMDVTMYTNLGIDSTKSEIRQTHLNSRHIYRAIKKLDEALGSLLLNTCEKSDKLVGYTE